MGWDPSRKDSFTESVPTDDPYMWYHNERIHSGPVWPIIGVVNGALSSADPPELSA